MSNPFGGFNQRPAEEPTPTPTTPQCEGPAHTPAPSSRYITKASELTPSEQRSTEINTDAVRDSVARMLSASDRQIAIANGTPDWLLDARNLNASVRKGEITPQQAGQIFRSVHKHITDEQLRDAFGGQS